MKKWIALIIVMAVLIGGGVFAYIKTRPKNSSSITNSNTTSQKKSMPSTTPTPTTTLAPPTQSQYALPVANFLTGQTKKPFGIYITPATFRLDKSGRNHRIN